MSLSDMENYRSVLEHVVRPEDPTERVEAESVRLEDYEALYLYDSVVQWASYEAESAEEEQIALGYAEYINDVVRNEKKNFVDIYPHTDVAEYVLRDALRNDGRDGHMTTKIRDSINESVSAE